GMVLLAATAFTFAPARAQSNTDDLMREIHRRDQVIDQLLRRVDALEKQARPATRLGSTAQPAPIAVAPISEPDTSPNASRIRQVAAPAPVQPAKPGATGDTEETMIARALENTLVDQGGLLLPPYSVQFVPDFSFAYSSIDQLAFFGPTGTIVRQRSHQYL